MDKASVLSDAIEYLKQLQEKVSFLEDQTAKKTIKSAVWVEKSHLHDDDDGGNSELLPKIEAKMFENTVLVKIHCEKHKGVLVKALSEIEKIHLSVVNTSVLLFTSSSLDITVMAQVWHQGIQFNSMSCLLLHLMNTWVVANRWKRGST